MISILRHEESPVRWIHISKASSQEIRETVKPLALHPLIERALYNPTLRSSAEEYEQVIYMTLQFPFFNEDVLAIQQREVDFVIKKDLLLTVTYQTLPIIDGLVASLGEEIKKNTAGEHAGFLLFELIRQLYAGTQAQLDRIEQSIVAIEENIFHGHERELVRLISLVRRDIIDVRRVIETHESVLVSLEQLGTRMFDKHFTPYLNALTGEYYKVWSLVENKKETVEALQETNDSLLSTRTGEITKNLTIMAFVTFPLMLLSSIFGMNTIRVPIVGSQYDFWIIIAIMAASTVGMFIFFKIKKWL